MTVIAFEGLDGVGTSIAARLAAMSFGGQVATRPALLPARIVRGRGEVNAGHDVEARFAFFVRLNERQIKLARGIEKNLGFAALDSSIYRTVATHRVLGSLAARQYQIEPRSRPDRALLLDMPEQDRLQRLMRGDGGITFSSHWDETLQMRQDDVRLAFEAFGLPKFDARLPELELVHRVARLLEI